jgi:hypothetical protein
MRAFALTLVAPIEHLDLNLSKTFLQVCIFSQAARQRRDEVQTLPFLGWTVIYALPAQAHNPHRGCEAGCKRIIAATTGRTSDSTASTGASETGLIGSVSRAWLRPRTARKPLSTDEEINSFSTSRRCRVCRAECRGADRSDRSGDDGLSGLFVEAIAGDAWTTAHAIRSLSAEDFRAFKGFGPHFRLQEGTSK